MSYPFWNTKKCYIYVKSMPLITKYIYVSKCLHLGTTIYTTLYRDNIIDVVNELYKRTNYLLSDFSFTESCTVSNLFNSFCMNLYSCQTWRFNNKKHLKYTYTCKITMSRMLEIKLLYIIYYIKSHTCCMEKMYTSDLET